MLKVTSRLVLTALLLLNTNTTRAEGVKAPVQTPTAQASSPANSKLENLIKERYLNYHQALLKANSFDDVAALRSSKLQSELEKKKTEAASKDTEAANKMMASLLGLAKSMEPRNVAVTAVTVNGDTAELSVSASDSGEFPNAMTKGIGSIATAMGSALNSKSASKPMRSTTTGKIKMVKEDGNWMVGEESWSTNVTNLTPAQEAARNAEDARKKGLSSWCSPAASMAFPQKPAAGKIHGQAFTVQGAEISNDILTLRQGSDFFADREFMIFIFGLDGKLAGQQIIVKNGEAVGKASCHVHMKWTVGNDTLPKTEMFMPHDGYGVRIAFGQRDAKTGLLPGYIVMRMPDKEQSFVQGYFYAKQK